MYLKVLNSDEGDACVYHSVASLRAWVRSSMEQMSRFFLPKAHVLFTSKTKGPSIFSHQQLAMDCLDNCFFSITRLTQ